jgi:PAS domain S-box-containing protein
MASTNAQHRALVVPVVLVVTGVAISSAYLLARNELGTNDGLGSAIVVSSMVVAAVAIFGRLRRPGAWHSTLWIGIAVTGLAAVTLLFLVREMTTDVAGARGYEAGFLLICGLFLIPVWIELRDHLPRTDRREIVADVALLSVAIGGILYLVLRPSDAGSTELIWSAITALVVASLLGAYGALALWLPTRSHVGLLAAIAILDVGLLAFARRWIDGTYQPGQAAIELPLALSAIVLALLVNTLPRHAAEEEPARPSRYGRAILTSVSVTTACAALAVVAFAETTDRLEPEQATVLIALLALAVALRILVNQVRGTNATRAAQDALDQKEIALRETDKALGRLQRMNETLRESEERLRTVFDAAVDGIVELDARNEIVRANEAFCRMIDLPHAMVEGQPWSALAASIEADESFATLPQTGQGTLRREGNAIYLESRISEVPGDPPRRLLLVRDVTASRVADQTIRSLFKFLQDRDEDRTRILRRTNAAIESERNRIARDLHDGPVQGVSAASLSLEAVLLMLKAGELQEGTEVLSKVRKELSEEADNLRRLMSGLRPPLLEERGLIPALREMLDKYGRDNGVQTEFTGTGTAEIPHDLETLAYRIVQEALSNSYKHAKATRVTISVEAVGGQLRLEIADDGEGFDSAKTREYLQLGRVGLASMRERVELANGTFMVHSTPGRGTTVMATLPLDTMPMPREFSVSEAS